MCTVELDRSKRLLVISAAQRVTAQEVKTVAQRVREVLHDVARGFRVFCGFPLAGVNGFCRSASPRRNHGHAHREMGRLCGAYPVKPAERHWSEYSVAIPLWAARADRDLRDADALQNIAAKVDSPPA